MKRLTKRKPKKKNPSTSAISPADLQYQIDKQWESRNRTTDWLQIESSIRDVYRFLHAKHIDKEEALRLISEIMAAYTRRGYPHGY